MSRPHLSPARRRLIRALGRTIDRYDLIADGDRILVAVSGGKDSYTLLDLLWELRDRAPVHFDVIAVHLDQGQPGYDGEPLEQWLEQLGAPYEIVRRDTYSKVLELTPPGQTFCAPCSRLRRGILYTTAERLGCNKIALGHHREDLLETFLMNLFYSGKLHALPARYRTQDDRFEVIRPLIEAAEEDIIEHASAQGFPILPCNLCGSQEGLTRVKVGKLLEQLEADNPGLRVNMLGAMRNLDPSRLLDTRWHDLSTANPDGELAPCRGRT